jgi:cytoskeletal protein RodZ
MGQEVRGVPEIAPLKGGPDDRERSIGRYLAGQRRLRGISIDDLASLTKVPRRSIERLEAGAFDRSSDGFVRGFVRVVADALGLDADEAVMRLLGEPDGAADEARRNAERRRAMLARVAIVAAALLLGVLLLRIGIALLSGEPDAEGPELIYRRDAVRALSDEKAP